MATSRPRRYPTTRNPRTRLTRRRPTRRRTTLSSLSSDTISGYAIFRTTAPIRSTQTIANELTTKTITPWTTINTLFTKYSLLYTLFPQHSRLLAITLVLQASSTYPTPCTLTWQGKTSTTVVTTAFKRHKLTFSITSSQLLSQIPVPTFTLTPTHPDTVFTYVTYLRFTYKRAPHSLIDPLIQHT